ncbi:MAG TPA: DUF4398 domain-containing protein [Geminicoccaceae bacterium]
MAGASAFEIGWRGMVIAAGVSVGLAACASDPAPEAELAAAEVAVDEAEEANAPAQAPGPYELARDKLERAREAMEDGENLEARRLAEQALVDAQLAEAEARSEVARQNAAALRASIETLQDEIARATPRTS